MNRCWSVSYVICHFYFLFLSTKRNLQNYLLALSILSSLSSLKVPQIRFKSDWTWHEVQLFLISVAFRQPVQARYMPPSCYVRCIWSASPLGVLGQLTFFETIPPTAGNITSTSTSALNVDEHIITNGVASILYANFSITYKYQAP